jgi:hypothetical protein
MIFREVTIQEHGLHGKTQCYLLRVPWRFYKHWTSELTEKVMSLCHSKNERIGVRVEFLFKSESKMKIALMNILHTDTQLTL